MLPRLLLDLWPQLSLLMSFAVFVVWNKGVVLGDRDNHIATINLPQMLYIWPATVFFSWPVLLPLFSNLSVLRQRLPRLTTTVIFMAIMLVVVNVNTVIHPFTLADNRHYTFYVFAIIRKHWLIKYAIVPVYYLCACLVLGALGGATNTAPASKGMRILHADDTVCASYALVWLLATSLSLIAAPLVEPRYFLIPWLTWRLAVPDYAPSSEESRARSKSNSEHSIKSSSSASSMMQSMLKAAAAWSGWLEFSWYVLVNLVTCYMFLYRGFEWPQEPRNVQRFMW